MQAGQPFMSTIYFHSTLISSPWVRATSLLIRGLTELKTEGHLRFYRLYLRMQTVEKKYIYGNLLAVVEVKFKLPCQSVGNTTLDLLTCS